MTMNLLNQRWVPRNRLTEARDRRSTAATAALNKVHLGAPEDSEFEEMEDDYAGFQDIEEDDEDLNGPFDNDDEDDDDDDDDHEWDQVAGPFDEARQIHEGAFVGDVTILGDANIDPNSGTIYPMAVPITRPLGGRPMINPNMVNPMGATTIDIRRGHGHTSLWAGTEIATALPASVGGDVDIDVTGLVSEWDHVGFEWCRRKQVLKAYLTVGHKTYTVKIPLRKLQRVANKHLKSEGLTIRSRETTLGGFFGFIKKAFKKVKKFVKKGVKDTVKSIKDGVTAPYRFIKNPKKFVKGLGNDLKRVVKGVGRTALNVASSPIFAGVMAGIAVIPPLTAIGAAGLAAYAAANAIKPAFNALDKGIDAYDHARKGKWGKALQSGMAAGSSAAKFGKGRIKIPKGLVKMGKTVGRMRNAVRRLPRPARGLMVAALKTTPAGRYMPRRRRVGPRGRGGMRAGLRAAWGARNMMRSRAARRRAPVFRKAPLRLARGVAQRLYA